LRRSSDINILLTPRSVKGPTPAGSVAGLDVSLGTSSGVGQDAISSLSSLILGTNANVSGACVTGGSPITISGSAARCDSTDTSGTSHC
jgi:hypothetical protein